ncbi:Beta-galactosidase [Cucumis melo var. makuwa]|uniref:Beta-galactosidase n=1 Tax=Cucumis melo var. makuwa TaxID=1194695 RepID=A0A5A7UFR4_CUCMM|nr:Beta-galactosidase [Cucumis melo var. makuwa]TYK01881.1 Beta-galactosidase [Cucumis melo var. makuwa]
MGTLEKVSLFAINIDILGSRVDGQGGLVWAGWRRWVMKVTHAPLLSGVWAYALTLFHLTAKPIPLYVPSDVLSYPSGHPHSQAPSMPSGQQPSTINLSNLYSKNSLYVDPLQQPLFSRNEIDQPHNRSDIEADESSTLSKPTELSMYSKNPVTSFPNLLSNYITGSLGSSTGNFSGLNLKFDTVCSRILAQRPLPSLMEVCFEVHLEEDCTNAMGVLTIPTIDSAAFSASVGNSTVVPQEVRNDPPTRNRTQDVPTLVRLPPASTSQSTGLTASQTKTPTLADDSLASIAGKGQIVSFGGFALQNVLHDMSLGRTIGTVRHSKGLYILDDDTSYKSEVSSIFQNFYHTIETQFHTKIAILQSDNGWEFQNHNLGEFLASKEIVHQTSCVYTPQQNGMIERKNRHLLEVARSLMFSTSLPSYLWGDAILTATHLINRTHSRILYLQTPLDCLKESYPSTRLVFEVPLRVFGVPLMSIILALIRPNFPIGLRLVCLLGIPFTSLVIHVFTCHPENTVTMMLLSVITDPTFLLTIFGGEYE